MKFILNNRCNPNYLQQADCIWYQWRDMEVLIDTLEKYPDKEIIIDIPYGESISPEQEAIFKTFKNRIILSCEDRKFFDWAQSKELKYFYRYPVYSFKQVQYLHNKGVYIIRVCAPIFFEWDKVKGYNIPIIAVPNLCEQDYFSTKIKDMTGEWIRPEDLESYNPDYIWFDTTDREREQTLFTIYKDKKEWSGTMDMLIDDFTQEGVYNRLIGPEVGQTRMNCGQRCFDSLNSTCHVCDMAARLANPKLYEYMNNN